MGRHKAKEATDWTAARGRSNSSALYLDIVDDVARVLRSNGGHCLSREWTMSMANLLVARMAHMHHLAPASPPPSAGEGSGS